MRLIQNDFGLGNNRKIDSDKLIANMHSIQRRNKLQISRDFEQRQYSIEMETGTGKTYVYTKNNIRIKTNATDLLSLLLLFLLLQFVKGFSSLFK